MASRGFLIRFIDVGLIVLFGFVMISDIEIASQVELSVAAATADVADEVTERAFVMVNIAADGRFSIVDSESGDLLAANVDRPDALAELLRFLKQAHAAQNRDLIVFIRPHEDSVVQRTVDVMDVCDRLALGKSLQMDLELRSAEDEA